jgi:hypothetical protein
MEYGFVALHEQHIIGGGAKTPYSLEIIYSGVLADGRTARMTEESYQELRSSGIRCFRGYLENGGGRHAFRGTDIEEVKRLVHEGRVNTVHIWE